MSVSTYVPPGMCRKCGKPQHSTAACETAAGWPAPNVVAEITAERFRQIADEGWTPEHDDTHDTGDLAVAAACYAINATWLHHIGKRELVDKYFPWPGGWKPKDPRRDLIRAAALIVAEIERLDRVAAGS